MFLNFPNPLLVQSEGNARQKTETEDVLLGRGPRNSERDPLKTMIYFLKLDTRGDIWASSSKINGTYLVRGGLSRCFLSGVVLQ